MVRANVFSLCQRVVERCDQKLVAEIVGCFLAHPTNRKNFFKKWSSKWSVVFLASLKMVVAVVKQMVAVFCFACAVSQNGRRFVSELSLCQKKWSPCFAVSKNDRRVCASEVSVSLCVCVWLLVPHSIGLCPRADTHTPEKDTRSSRHGEEKEKNIVATTSGGHTLAQNFLATTQPSDDHVFDHRCGHARRPFCFTIFRHCAYSPKKPSLPIRTAATPARPLASRCNRREERKTLSTVRVWRRCHCSSARLAKGKKLQTPRRSARERSRAVQCSVLARDR